MVSFSFSVDHAHPCLDGHFQGNPVVPGAVIVDEVMRGLLSKKPAIKIINISLVKFLKVIRPNQTVHVTVTEKKEDILQFTGSINDSPVVSGTIRIRRPGES